MGKAFIATTGETPCSLMFSICLRRLSAPAWTSSEVLLQHRRRQGAAGDDAVLARVCLQRSHVATRTAASGSSPE